MVAPQLLSLESKIVFGNPDQASCFWNMCSSWLLWKQFMKKSYINCFLDKISLDFNLNTKIIITYCKPFFGLRLKLLKYIYQTLVIPPPAVFLGLRPQQVGDNNARLVLCVTTSTSQWLNLLKICYCSCKLL